MVDVGYILVFELDKLLGSHTMVSLELEMENEKAAWAAPRLRISTYAETSQGAFGLGNSASQVSNCCLLALQSFYHSRRGIGNTTAALQQQSERTRAVAPAHFWRPPNPVVYSRSATCDLRTADQEEAADRIRYLLSAKPGAIHQ